MAKLCETYRRLFFGRTQLRFFVNNDVLSFLGGTQWRNVRLSDFIDTALCDPWRATPILRNPVSLVCSLLARVASVMYLVRLLKTICTG